MEDFNDGGPPPPPMGFIWILIQKIPEIERFR